MSAAAFDEPDWDHVLFEADYVDRVTITDKDGTHERPDMAGFNYFVTAIAKDGSEEFWYSGKSLLTALRAARDGAADLGVPVRGIRKAV